MSELFINGDIGSAKAKIAAIIEFEDGEKQFSLVFNDKGLIIGDKIGKKRDNVENK